jgi:molecular chaperone GrpE
MEINNVKKYALQKFIEDLLTVADNLSLASNAKKENYEQFIGGLNMTINIFMNTLKKYGVEEIITKIGDLFDESMQECLAVREEGSEIVQILKPGYKYGERIIRAAQVIVGKI